MQRVSIRRNDAPSDWLPLRKSDVVASRSYYKRQPISEARCIPFSAIRRGQGSNHNKLGRGSDHSRRSRGSDHSRRLAAMRSGSLGRGASKPPRPTLKRFNSVKWKLQVEQKTKLVDYRNHPERERCCKKRKFFFPQSLSTRWQADEIDALEQSFGCDLSYDFNDELDDDEPITFQLPKRRFRRQSVGKTDRQKYDVVYNKQTGKHDVVEKQAEPEATKLATRKSSIALLTAPPLDLNDSCSSLQSVHSSPRSVRVDLGAALDESPEDPLQWSSHSLASLQSDTSAGPRRTMRTPIARSVSDQQELKLLAMELESPRRASKKIGRSTSEMEGLLSMVSPRESPRRRLSRTMSEQASIGRIACGVPAVLEVPVTKKEEEEEEDAVHLPPAKPVRLGSVSSEEELKQVATKTKKTRTKKGKEKKSEQKKSKGKKAAAASQPPSSTKKESAARKCKPAASPKTPKKESSTMLASNSEPIVKEGVEELHVKESAVKPGSPKPVLRRFPQGSFASPRTEETQSRVKWTPHNVGDEDTKEPASRNVGLSSPKRRRAPRNATIESAGTETTPVVSPKPVLSRYPQYSKASTADASPKTPTKPRRATRKIATPPAFQKLAVEETFVSPKSEDCTRKPHVSPRKIATPPVFQKSPVAQPVVSSSSIHESPARSRWYPRRLGVAPVHKKATTEEAAPSPKTVEPRTKSSDSSNQSSLVTNEPPLEPEPTKETKVPDEGLSPSRWSYEHPASVRKDEEMKAAKDNVAPLPFTKAPFGATKSFSRPKPVFHKPETQASRCLTIESLMGGGKKSTPTFAARPRRRGQSVADRIAKLGFQ